MDRPHKRRRLLSPDMDLNDSRARNNARLKATFESIFEKYGRDFSGVGDEIDLKTGEIVVNNGHLLGMADEKHMFDESNTETGFQSPERGKEDGCKSYQPIGIAKSPVDKATSEVSWLSAGADSLMEDELMLDCLSVVNGAGNQKIKLSGINHGTGKGRLPPSVFVNGRGKLSAVGRPKLNSRSSDTRPQQHIGATPKEEPAIEISWCVPPLPKPAPGLTMQHARPLSMNDGAKSERFVSPPGFPPRAPTKDMCIMPRWTQQEDSLLLLLRSDTTLGCTEVTKHFNERFPHRSFGAIQNHWCRKRRSNNSCKRVGQDEIAKSSIVEPPTRETRMIASSRTVKDLQQLSSPHLPASRFPENIGTMKRGGKYTPYESTRDRTDVHKELSPANVPELGIKSGVTRLTQSLKQHARLLSGTSISSSGVEGLGQSLQEHGRSRADLSTTTKREQCIPLSTAQKAPRPLETRYSSGDSVAKLGKKIRSKSGGTAGASKGSAATASYAPPSLHTHPVSTNQSKTHKSMNITAATKSGSTEYQPVQRMTSHIGRPEGNGSTAMPRDDVQKPSSLNDHTRLVPLPPAAAVQASSNANRSTLLRPQASSSKCIDPYIDRKTQPRTLLSLSASHRDAAKNNALPISKSRLLPGSQPMVRAAQTARRNPVGNPIKTPLVAASTRNNISPNHTVRADEASRNIKSSLPAETRISLLQGQLSATNQLKVKRDVQGATSAKSLTSHTIDMSDDELSTPIKTIGTPSVPRVISSISKKRRKTLK